MAVVSTTVAISAAESADLEATATTHPMIMATTTTPIRTTLMAIPITTMTAATRCGGACIRAPVGTFTRSKSATDPAAFEPQKTRPPAQYDAKRPCQPPDIEIGLRHPVNPTLPQ